jgi:hypothetical protein
VDRWTDLGRAPVANEEIRLATVLIIAMHATPAMLLVVAAIIFATVQSLIYAAIIFGSCRAWFRFGVALPGFPTQFRLVDDAPSNVVRNSTESRGDH